jgi:hypothetical protein
VVSHLQAAREAVDDGVARLVSTLAVILPCLALLQVIANTGDYRQPAAAAAVWLAVLGAGAWLVPRVRAGGLSPRQTAAAIAIAVGAVALVDLEHRARGTMGGIDLAVLGAGWLLVPVVMSSPALVWLPAALLLLAVHAALLIHGEGLDPVGLSQLAGAAYIVAALLILFTVLRPALDARAALAARQAAMASRSAAEQAAAGAIEQERRVRLAALEREALPLLRSIADGTLDPADESVRARCAGHAAVLRQSIDGDALSGRPPGAQDEPAHGEPSDGEPAYAEPGDAEPGDAEPGDAEPGDAEPGDAEPGDAEPGDAEPDDAEPDDGDPAYGEPGHDEPGGQRPQAGLAAVLAPALRAAAARKLAVTVQLIGGHPASPPPPVARAACAAVDAVLSRLPPHQVLLTVLAAGDDVELYLTFGAPLASPPDLTALAAGVPAAARWHAAVSAADDGAGCLEISWRGGGTR